MLPVTDINFRNGVFSVVDINICFVLLSVRDTDVRIGMLFVKCVYLHSKHCLWQV